MLAQLLTKHGIATRVEGAEILATNRIEPFDTSGVRLVCLSFLDTTTPVHVRFAVRRMRRRVPDARILVGAWGLGRDDATGLCSASRADACASRLSEALRFCMDAATNEAAGKEAAEHPDGPVLALARASAA